MCVIGVIGIYQGHGERALQHRCFVAIVVTIVAIVLCARLESLLVASDDFGRQHHSASLFQRFGVHDGSNQPFQLRLAVGVDKDAVAVGVASRVATHKHQCTLHIAQV